MYFYITFSDKLNNVQIAQTFQIRVKLHKKLFKIRLKFGIFVHRNRSITYDILKTAVLWHPVSMAVKSTNDRDRKELLMKVTIDELLHHLPFYYNKKLKAYK